VAVNRRYLQAIIASAVKLNGKRGQRLLFLFWPINIKYANRFNGTADGHEEVCESS
jgi:hypothetical protein